MQREIADFAALWHGIAAISFGPAGRTILLQVGFSDLGCNPKRACSPLIRGRAKSNKNWLSASQNVRNCSDNCRFRLLLHALLSRLPRHGSIRTSCHQIRVLPSPRSLCQRLQYSISWQNGTLSACSSMHGYFRCGIATLSPPSPMLHCSFRPAGWEDFICRRSDSERSGRRPPHCSFHDASVDGDIGSCYLL